MALDTRTRTQLLLSLARMGVSDYHARKLARYASRLDTLNEALCNGDWPCDNGERKTLACDRCQCAYVPSVMRRELTQRRLDRKGGMARAIFEGYAIVECPAPGFSNCRSALTCPDCRTQDLVRAVCAEAGLAVEFAGDPRGMPFKVERAQEVSQ